MPKGFFTQGLIVLLRQPVVIGDVRARLGDFKIVNETSASEIWEISGPALVVAYRPEVNGLVAIDAVDHPWPDDMGNPKTEAMRLGSWATGHFGPFTYPNGLRRAVQQAWSWPDAGKVVEAHSAFVRLKLSYVFGARAESKVMPRDCDPRDELEFLTGLGRALLALPGALCWFDPSGEIVLPRSLVERRWAFGRANGLAALDLWSNVRLFKLADGWSMMDTVGNGQLDLPDLEAVFRTSESNPRNVDAFLRNATTYLLDTAATIKDGDTIDGPGDVPWRGYRFENGLCDPPREVIRWFAPGGEDAAPLPARPPARRH